MDQNGTEEGGAYWAAIRGFKILMKSTKHMAIPVLNKRKMV